LFKNENNLETCFEKLKDDVDSIKKVSYSKYRFEIEFFDNIIIYGIVYNGSISKACWVNNIYVDSELNLNEDDFNVLYSMILDLEPHNRIISFKISS